MRPLGPVICLDGSLAARASADDQATRRVAAVSDAGAHRVARLLLVRHFDFGRGAGVHGSGDPGIGLSVHQHPDDPHG